MSSEKFPLKNKFPFDECWERVKAGSKIKNYSQLAEFVGTSKSNVTKRKDEGYFPVEWAFYVARDNNLTTEWILTGENCKREVKEGYEFLIKEWVELMSNGQGKKWFENQFESAFPMFKAWKEEKEGNAKFETDYPASKIA